MGAVYASVLFPGIILNALGLGAFRETLFCVCLYGISLFFARIADRWIGVYCSRKADEFEEVLVVELAEAAAGIPYSELEAFSTREQYELAGKSISRNSVAKVLQSMLDLVFLFLTVSGILYIASYLAWWLWIVLLVSVALETACEIVRINYNYESYEEQNSVEMNMCYFRDWMPHRDYAKEVRLYGMAPYIKERIGHWIDALALIQKKRASKTFKALWWSHLVDGALIFTIYSYMGVLCLRQVIGAGEFIVSVSAVFELDRAGIELAKAFLTMAEEGRYIQSFRAFLDRRGREGTWDPSGTCRPEFVFDDVSFRYEGAKKDAISHLSLTIRPGRHYGIVGANGAGKSTFVKLLMGLYEPNCGEIRCNGTDIRRLRKDSYWEYFSVTFQDYQTFAFQVDENIAAQGQPQPGKCLEAAEKAGILNKILSLPKQFSTCLGREYDEDGAELSMGEQQKLALARMIYKDAPVWILDEPTAALSPKSEFALYEQLGQLTGDRTVLFISHRMASCRLCDEILVFDGNRLAEQGTHEQLMSAGGLYKAMFDAQAKYYDKDYHDGMDGGA